MAISRSARLSASPAAIAGVSYVMAPYDSTKMSSTSAPPRARRPVSSAGLGPSDGVESAPAMAVAKRAWRKYAGVTGSANATSMGKPSVVR